MGATLPVDSVADTALLTAFCRAVESERPDAHFSDPYARKLAGAKGAELLRRFSGGELTAAGCAVRTCVLDSLIMETIRTNPVDTVLNLGAGLDTRAYRLPIPSSITWVEVDDPTVLAYKSEILCNHPPVCSLETASLDLTDVGARRDFLACKGTRAGHALVVTEGVLVYMKPDDVGSLARDLSQSPSFQWWVTDMVSPSALRLMQSRHCESPNTGKVGLCFAPEEGPGFFRCYGWKTDEIRSCLKEGQRLNRPFLSDILLTAELTDEQRQILVELYSVVRLRKSALN